MSIFPEKLEHYIKERLVSYETYCNIYDGEKLENVLEKIPSKVKIPERCRRRLNPDLPINHSTTISVMETKDEDFEEYVEKVKLDDETIEKLSSSIAKKLGEELKKYLG